MPPKRNKVAVVQLTTQELAQLKLFCQLKGVAVSSYIRQLILENINRKQETGQQ